MDSILVPEHLAIIMDGNGRWAQQRGQDRIYGHRYAVQAVRETCELCAELGVKYLTLYTFSSENWARPAEEVSALMQLLVDTIQSELDTLMKNQISLHAFGDLDMLPAECREQLANTSAQTSGNTRMQLNLALSYSSRNELLHAVRAIAMEVQQGTLNPEDIDEKVISGRLQTSTLPDPELLIRTSGEMRISNFLLWQLAYAELYFTSVCWPDFRKEHLQAALEEYSKRERRFGKTSAQVNATKG
ncbi:MAG: isoprenyl transferase [Bacteroidota bacterium]